MWICSRRNRKTYKAQKSDVMFLFTAGLRVCCTARPEAYCVQSAPVRSEAIFITGAT